MVQGEQGLRACASCVCARAIHDTREIMWETSVRAREHAGERDKERQRERESNTERDRLGWCMS